MSNTESIVSPDSILMAPRRVTRREDLKARQPYLIATITSGDHPIQWNVYDRWEDWLKDQDLDEDALDHLDFFYVYELSYSYSQRFNPRSMPEF